jgi:hypothetical protein
MLTSYEIFKKLPGVWALSRSLINSLEPQASGTVTGSAKFTLVTGDDDLLHYRETGEYINQAGKFPISREYFFAYNQSTKEIEKYFSENGIKAGLFYVLSQDLQGKHLCAADNYNASYKYENDDFQEFELTYEVTGPKKNYISKTRYTYKSS